MSFPHPRADGAGMAPTFADEKAPTFTDEKTPTSPADTDTSTLRGDAFIEMGEDPVPRPSSDVHSSVDGGSIIQPRM
jgi:hypothetical protein